MRTFDIDARKDVHPDFREMSLAGAIAAFLDQIEKGEAVCVRSTTDAFGDAVPVPSFRASMASVKNGRRFVTKSGKDGILLVMRIA
jgi:hypothetical protein